MGSPWTGVSVLFTTERGRGADINCNGPKDYKEPHAGCKESHFYSLPFGQAEANIY